VGRRKLHRSRAMLSRWDSSAKVFLPGGRPPAIGDWLVQSDLRERFP